MSIDNLQHRVISITSDPAQAAERARSSRVVRPWPESPAADKILIDARERADATLDCIGDGIVCSDVAGAVTYLNKAAEALTGWSRHYAAGRPLHEVLPFLDPETGGPAPLLTADTKIGRATNGVLVGSDGRPILVEHKVSPLHDKRGRPTGAVMVLRHVGAARTAREHAHLAQHDALTGLPLRPLVHDRLGAAIALAHRRGKWLAVGFLDVDGFKDVNDSLGHAAGDLVLCSMATRLRLALRQSDTVGRYGGDEFVIVLPEIEQAADATRVAAKVLDAVARPLLVGDGEITVAASLGMAIYPEHGQTIDTLIANADTAMYHAKRDGPGRWRLFDGEPESRRFRHHSPPPPTS